jgi:hypothetical protein
MIDDYESGNGYKVTLRNKKVYFKVGYRLEPLEFLDHKRCINEYSRLLNNCISKLFDIMEVQSGDTIIYKREEG